MSGTFHLTQGFYYALLNMAGNKAERMKKVASLRKDAIQRLGKAIARLPVETPSIIAAYRAKGMERVWVLEENYDAKRIYWELRDCDPTPDETEAAELLIACVAAQEAGDVIEFEQKQAAIRQSEGNKAGGKALKKLTLSGEKRMAERYWQRVENGEKYGALKELAGEFSVSRQTVSAVIKKYKPNSIDK